ncbi:MAG: penicillin-binding protein 1C [Syntrophobacteraceae bacterium]|nr:penicillin-binding protein 1C [Syntrophobacteraceae bacterium]
MFKRSLTFAFFLLAAWFVFLAAGRIIASAPLSSRFSSSVAVYDANHNLLRLTLSADQKYRLWSPLENISPLLVQAILLHEDRHFTSHFGINPLSLVRAGWETYFAGGRRMGGSTITMQLARLIYHINSRTLPGKLRQIFCALALEFCHSKDEILEAYLNLVPYSRNIEGVGAASLIYFGKTADRLSLPEALSLAVIPQSPFRRTPDRLSGGALADARKALYEKWRKKHPGGQMDAALVNLPLVARDTPELPFLAPHYVNALLARHRRGEKSEIIGTLDLRMQRIVEQNIRAYVLRRSRDAIRNAAAMIVDSRTVDVKAQVGSADFFRKDIQGQVDGTRAKRSPGSTLKPFIYALGIDQGLIYPMTMLKDAPLVFGSYNPENFDGRFEGPISAKDALIRSRNIPALWIASRLAHPSFYEFLKSCSLSGLRSEKHYGLSLALGGGEVTMAELVELYAMLANRGVFKPLRYCRADPIGEGVRVLSPEASFITLDMLKDNPRPGRAMRCGGPSGSMPPVSWKTGTSDGFRDAWAVGVFGPYVMAVWVGNFKGEGNQAFVGLKAAAPLFFEIVDALKARGWDLTAPPRPRPANVSRVEVCSVSGELPGPDCPHKKWTWFIPGKSPIKVCDIHRRVAIDDKTGLIARSPFHGPIHTEVFEFWPSNMLKIFQQAGIPRRLPPAADPGSAVDVTAASGNPPKIISPVNHLTYALRSSGGENRTIAFRAVTDADVREVYWLLDESYVGKSGSGEPFFWTAKPGDYVLRAVDDRGRSDSRELKVSLVQ